MAVASVTKITAASSEGFDAAVREGLARANRTCAALPAFTSSSTRRASRTARSTSTGSPWR